MTRMFKLSDRSLKKKKKKTILADLVVMVYNMGEKMKERYKLYKKEPGEMIDMKTK